MTASIRHFVGRERELAALLGLLEAPEALPATATVVGEAGIGKTALSFAAAKEAKARGYTVLSTRPSETDARFSFAGLADLIGGLAPDVLPQLPRPQRRALEGALALSEAGGASADEGVVAFALLGTLQRAAVRHPLLLLIDDVQWLDAPSLAMLRFALARLEREKVATILTSRDEVPHWLPRAVPEERLLNVELGPLSVGALREILRERAGAVFPRPTLRRIWETSGGNPFYALELASALQRRGGRVDPGEELPIPANLAQLIHDRIDRLGADGIEVARIVAALANPTLRVVESAAGGCAATGLPAAVEAEVLEIDGDRLRFSHPLIRSAVYARSGTTMRRHLHARLANVVHDREEKARHLALATLEPSREVASVVEEAAIGVRARGAAAAAAELAELAIRLTPITDVDEMRRRFVDCADRHREAGDGRRAITLLEQAYKTAPHGAARAAVLVRLARALAEFVSLREGVDRYRQALDEAEGDDSLTAEIHLNLAGLVAVTEDWNRALEHAELAVQAASRVLDSALRCRALAMFGYAHFRMGRGIPRDEMEEALRLERSLPGWPLTDAAAWASVYQLIWSGELKAVRPLLEEMRETLNRREDPEEALAHWYLSLMEWRAGNWESAVHHAADLLTLRAQFGLEGGQPIDEWPAALIAAYRGQIDDARDRSERALAQAEADGVRVAQACHRLVLGFIELSLGNAAKALGYLEPGWEIRDSLLILEPGHRYEVADTLEALIAVGRLAEAETKLVPWEKRARSLDRAGAIAITARCRALLLAAHGDLAGAQLSFERALAQHARTEDPFEHARTLLAFGVTQRRAKQRGTARRTLEQALDIFERLGAPLWAEKTRAELKRIGGRTPSLHELTEAEGRIARLVAEGRTNRDVAAALFITEHTVEGALTRTYQKLGVRSRAELALRLRSTRD